MSCLTASAFAAPPSSAQIAKATEAAKQMLVTYAETQAITRDATSRLRLGVPLPIVQLTLEDIREAGEAPEARRSEILQRWSGNILFPVMLEGRPVGFVKVHEKEGGKMEVVEMGGEQSPELELFRLRTEHAGQPAQ